LGPAAIIQCKRFLEELGEAGNAVYFTFIVACDRANASVEPRFQDHVKRPLRGFEYFHLEICIDLCIHSLPGSAGAEFGSELGRIEPVRNIVTIELY